MLFKQFMKPLRIIFTVCSPFLQHFFLNLVQWIFLGCVILWRWPTWFSKLLNIPCLANATSCSWDFQDLCWGKFYSPLKFQIFLQVSYNALQLATELQNIHKTTLKFSTLLLLKNNIKQTFVKYTFWQYCSHFLK